MSNNSFHQNLIGAYLKNNLSNEMAMIRACWVDNNNRVQCLCELSRDNYTTIITLPHSDWVLK